MDGSQNALVQEFIEKALSVKSRIHEAKDFASAIDYVLSVCSDKVPSELLYEEPGTAVEGVGLNGMPARKQKIIAAPDFSAEEFSLLEKKASDQQFKCIREGLRSYLAGFDVGIEYAAFGAASTATCMVVTDSEDACLAGMVSEISVILLPKSRILPDVHALAEHLKSRQTSSNASFTSFISGPSYTGDIENVGVSGVHGPLELHIILLES